MRKASRISRSRSRVKTGCIQNVQSTKPRWKFEKPLKNPCVTRKLTPEDFAAFINGDLEIEPDIQIDKRLSLPVRQEKIPSIATTGVFLPQGAITKNPVEVLFCKEIAKAIGGLTEFSCPDGRIDVLSEKYLIEVKIAHNWKHAIGQCLVYSHYFPSRAPVVFLIGDNTDFYSTTAKQHCDRLGIVVCTDLEMLL